MAAIRDFVEQYREAVVKPIDGHAGRGVFRLIDGDPNVTSLIEVMTGRGAHPTAIQAWVPAASRGNKRILLYDSHILGAVNRVPEPADFRTGAPCSAAPITCRDREIVAEVIPALRARGLRLVGLDVIGDYLVEINVTSPGGIRQAEGLGHRGMATQVLELVARERRHRRPTCPPIDRPVPAPC
jgi:glutathione synthase